MEGTGWIAGIAALAAFGAGACLCAQGAAALRARGHAARSLRGQGDSAAEEASRTMLLRNGVAPFTGLAGVLLRSKRAGAFAALLVQVCRLRGWHASETGVLSVVCAVCAALAVGGIAAGSVALAAAAPLTALVGMGLAAHRALDRERERLRDAVPEVLRSLSACFHAGYTLLQTFRQVAQEAPADIARYFDRAASALETGRTVEQVLGELRSQMAVPELAFAIVALEVQHRTGGSVRSIVEAAGDAVGQELALRRSLRVQTAQARLSAQVVTIMPFALIAVLSLFTRDFLAPFFASPAGVAVLAVALGMQAAGVLAVRRLLEVGDL